MARKWWLRPVTSSNQNTLGCREGGMFNWYVIYVVIQVCKLLLIIIIIKSLLYLLFLEKCPQCTLMNVYPYLNKTQNMLLSPVQFTLSCYSYFPICRGANLEFKRTSSSVISPQPKIYSLSQTPQPKANTGAGLPPFSLSYFPGSVGLLPTGHIYSNMPLYFTSPIKMMLALWYQVW